MPNLEKRFRSDSTDSTNSNVRPPRKRQRDFAAEQYIESRSQSLPPRLDKNQETKSTDMWNQESQNARDILYSWHTVMHNANMFKKDSHYHDLSEDLRNLFENLVSECEKTHHECMNKEGKSLSDIGKVTNELSATMQTFRNKIQTKEVLDKFEEQILSRKYLGIDTRNLTMSQIKTVINPQLKIDQLVKDTTTKVGWKSVMKSINKIMPSFEKKKIEFEERDNLLNSIAFPEDPASAIDLIKIGFDKRINYDIRWRALKVISYTGDTLATQELVNALSKGESDNITINSYIIGNVLPELKSRGMMDDKTKSRLIELSRDNSTNEHLRFLLKTHQTSPEL